MRVLGIDPGYGRIGIAVVEKLPGSRERLIHSDCIETDAAQSFEGRLAQIGKKITEVISAHLPDRMAIEQLYFEKNRTTGIGVAEARGVIRYIAALHALPVFEYAPLEIKAAVVGDGRAHKEQLMRLLPKLIVIEKNIRLDDEYDAIAVGLTCLAIERH